MKKEFTLIALLFITLISWSQNGINYKAIIKDASGNAIVNGNITLHFSILKTTSTGTLVYKESHTTATDANGLIIRSIGEGTPITNTFSSIKWESDTHFLKVEIDTGAGLVNMGTTEFNNVPYAHSTSSITESPNRTFEVAGEGSQNLRINSKNTGRTSLEFLNTNSGDDWKFENTGLFLDIKVSDDNLATSEGKFTFRSDGRLGVNTINPNTELDVNGTIRSSDLTGSGLRNVSANSQGNLVIGTEPKIGYYVVPAIAFKARSGTNIWITGTGASGETGTRATLFAPVNLPHGVTVTGVKLIYEDNSTSNVFVGLRRTIFNDNISPSSDVWQGETSGAADGNRFIENTNLSHVVDNQLYSYYIVTIFTEDAYEWTGSSNLSIKSMVITYEE